MWRTGRTPPWAPALTGALLLLLATPLWSQQDGGMDFDQVTGVDPQVPVDGYILLAPYIHHSAPTSAESNSDWADPKVLRLILLGLLNGVGITGLNDLTVIEFKMPEARPWPTATVCRRRCTRATTTAPTSPR